MLFKFVVIIAVVAVALAASSDFFKIESMNHRHDFVLHSKPDPEVKHEVIFAIKQKNLDILEKEVLERATPGSSKYLQWMTFWEVGKIIENLEGYQATVDWLASNGIQVSKMAILPAQYTLLRTNVVTEIRFPGPR